MFGSIKKVKVKQEEMKDTPVAKVMAELGMALSLSKSRRCIHQGSVTIDEQMVTPNDPYLTIRPKGTKMLVKVGKSKVGIIEVV